MVLVSKGKYQASCGRGLGNIWAKIQEIHGMMGAEGAKALRQRACWWR